MLRALFERADGILSESKLDEEFLALAIRDQKIELAKMSAKEMERFARFTALALRSNIARRLSGLAHREFCARLGDSPLLQWFLQVGEIDQIKVFAKSTSDRFGRWINAESMRAINQRLIALLGIASEEASQTVAFGLKDPVQLEEVFLDSTCLKANIHFPVDWVLLRDAARTLMKATLCIRKAGLKERMPQGPEEFLSEMNKLCMAMSAGRRTKDGKKSRKRILRKMKKLEGRIGGHARAHCDALLTRRGETELSEGQARVIIKRIEGVLEQLPAAIKQAHERIIGGRQVANEDKILSLHDPDINVIVRGKAGAEVEFGNKLWLAESRQGLVLDYALYEDNPADTTLVKPSIERLTQDMKLPIQSAWGDRGLFSKKNVAHLESNGIASGLCPRNPAELAAKLQLPGVREGMKRRGSTEARIAIFKSMFMGQPTRGKSFAARELAAGWAVLTHNLWVLARLPQATQKTARRSKADTIPPGALKRAA